MTGAQAADFDVDTTNDTPDADPGNGVCADAAGDCSLRAAFEEHNASGGTNTINLPAGTYSITSRLVDGSGDLTLAGADKATTIIESAGDSVAIEIDDFVTLSISGVTFTDPGSDANCFFAGAPSTLSTVTMTNVAFDDCEIGILIDDSAVTLDVTNGEFSGPNMVEGILFSSDTDGDVTVTDSSFSEIAAEAILYSAVGGSLVVDDSTFTDIGREGVFFDGNNAPGTLTVVDSDFLRAVSSDGGAAIFVGTDSGAGVTMEVNRTTIVDTGSARTSHGIWASQSDNVISIIDTEIINAGGIGAWIEGEVDIIRSTFASNDRGIDWIDRIGDNPFLLQDSTVSGNDFFGAILQSGAEVGNILNSTFSGNGTDGSDFGLGLFEGEWVVAYTTITDNVVGVAPYANQTDFLASIVSGNGRDCDFDPVILSSGFNIDGDGNCLFANANDLPSTDAMLGALGDNGGPTETHLLLPGSPAIDLVTNGALCDPLPADQRQISRPQGAYCDSGSVEVVQQTNGTTTTSSQPPVTTAPPSTTAAPTTTTAAPTTTVAPTSTLPETGLGDDVRGFGWGGLVLVTVGMGLVILTAVRSRQQE